MVGNHVCSPFLWVLESDGTRKKGNTRNVVLVGLGWFLPFLSTPSVALNNDTLSTERKKKERDEGR